MHSLRSSVRDDGKGDGAGENGGEEKTGMKDKLIDAIDSVTWYNGLAPIIVNWKRDDYFDKYENYSMSWNWDTFNHYDEETRSQLEVIWIICVELFGEYGTSPRSGWILMENKEQFYKFIDDITETYRDSLK